MPKISEVINGSQLAPLQQSVLSYLQKHNDEVFSYVDAAELAKIIDHKGSVRGVAFSLWALHKKGLIDKERVGKRVYFGSKGAITYLRKQIRH